MFLLGHWKNYEELEDNLSMPELLATLMAARDRDSRDRRFHAALQGVDLDKEASEKTLDDVRQRVKAKQRGADPDANDIIDVDGGETGLGIGFGLGYEQI